MTTKATLASVLEAALNLYLKQGYDTLARCAALEGKVIGIDFMLPGFCFYFLPDANGVQVLSHYEGTVDTRLTGSPASFARLTVGDREDALFAGAVKIEGDTDTGQKFQELLAASDWDWEEQLSRVTGDIVAHGIGDVARRAQRLARDGLGILEQDIGEYLQEEARLLPAREEVTEFMEQVDILRSATDRMMARVERLLHAGDPVA